MKKKIAEIKALHQEVENAVAKLAFISGVRITVGMTPAGILGTIAASSAVSAALDPSLRQGIASGDWEAAASRIVNHLPVTGSCKNAQETYQKGDYKTACLFGVLASVEGCGFAKGIKEGGVFKSQKLNKQGDAVETAIEAKIPAPQLSNRDLLNRLLTEAREAVKSNGLHASRDYIKKLTDRYEKHFGVREGVKLEYEFTYDKDGELIKVRYAITEKK